MDPAQDLHFVQPPVEVLVTALRQSRLKLDPFAALILVSGRTPSGVNGRVHVALFLERDKPSRARAQAAVDYRMNENLKSLVVL